MPFMDAAASRPFGCCAASLKVRACQGVVGGCCCCCHGRWYQHAADAMHAGWCAAELLVAHPWQRVAGQRLMLGMNCPLMLSACCVFRLGRAGDARAAGSLTTTSTPLRSSSPEWGSSETSLGSITCTTSMMTVTPSVHRSKLSCTQPSCRANQAPDQSHKFSSVLGASEQVLELISPCLPVLSCP